MRQGKELILATKPFTVEIRWKSWFHTTSTFFILVFSFTSIFLVTNFFVQLIVSIFTGLVMVRMFVIYHDYVHRSILQRSAAAKAWFTFFGMYILAPTSIWKRSHDYHHNHNSKLFSASIGSYPILTRKKYLRISQKQRLYYLFVRHPITMFFGYFSAFMYGMCINSFTSSFKKHWDSVIALIFHFSLGTAIFIFLGWKFFILLFFIPHLVSSMMGAYLFYAQHNFPGVTFKDNIEWSYDNAALESSSYMVMNPFWKWVTANIGYHHIHHINSRIPFYRLPEVFESIPELQQAKTTSLNPVDIFRCLRLKIWDSEKNKMIALSEL